MSFANNDLSCGGVGKFRTCDRSPGIGSWNYGYTYNWPVSTASASTAEEVMKVFKQNPAAIFPFDVEGCARFYSGAECTLKTAAPTTNPDGVVGVTTTPTSVKFTVIERGYFDAPGSTIEFKTWTSVDGTIYFSQVADAHGTDFPTWIGVQLGAARGTWDKQQKSLIGALGG